MECGRPVLQTRLPARDAVRFVRHVASWPLFAATLFCPLLPRLKDRSIRHINDRVFWQAGRTQVRFSIRNPSAMAFATRKKTV